MNPKKAIEILKEHIEWCDPVKEVDTFDTLKLGKEALEREEANRANPDFVVVGKLPSETE